MNSADTEVLGQASRWCAEGRYTLLVTLVDAWGSAPRPVGSLLALTADGLMAGSVSGGCLEDDLLRRAAAYGASQGPTLPEITRYGIDAEEARRFGLPCGGTLTLVIERLHSKSGIEETLAALSHHERVVRALDLVTGVATVERAAAQKTLSFDGTVLRSVHGPRWRLLVIGAGPIAEYLVDMSAALDLAVTVCDPRPEYQASWRRTDCPLDTAMPDDAVVAFKPDVSSAIVALTHDPKQDDLALMEALQSEAFYVGALGSRAAQEKRRQRLLEFVSAEQLSKLKGPVGLPIGSRSPPELAIAILADLIACKNGIMLQRREEKPSGGMP